MKRQKRNEDDFLIPDGHKLKQFRKKKGWTQEDLADKAGVDKRTIQRMESDQPTRPSSLGFVAEALGEKVQDLLLSDADSITQKEVVPKGLSGHNTFITNAPSMPKVFVGRDEVLKEIKQKLAPSNGRSDSNNCSQLIIQGLPGVGKSTLSIVLANDPELQELFPDGILWVTLGQKPNVYSEMCSWARLLNVTDILTSRTVKDASELLSSALKNKNMLMIIDDVWDIESGKSFCVGGNHCAALITTRLPEIAQALSVLPDKIFPLPVLSEKHSVQLLKMIAPVVEECPEEAIELVRTVEYLPLAIQVAGHLIQAEEKMGWGIKEFLTELKDESRILQSQAPADCIDILSQTIPTVAVLLKKSTDMLDENTRDCFMKLGVFAPKPATFNIEAMRYVWENQNPKPIIRTLVSRGLLEPIKGGKYQIHSLLVSHAKSLFSIR